METSHPLPSFSFLFLSYINSASLFLLLIQTQIPTSSQWPLPLFSQPLCSFLYSSPLSSFLLQLLISTKQLTLPGEMAALRFSTMATFLLSPSTEPPALDFSPEMSICTERSICKSSSFLATLPAPSLLTT